MRSSAKGCCFFSFVYELKRTTFFILILCFYVVSNDIHTIRSSFCICIGLTLTLGTLSIIWVFKIRFLLLSCIFEFCFRATSSFCVLARVRYKRNWNYENIFNFVYAFFSTSWPRRRMRKQRQWQRQRQRQRRQRTRSSQAWNANKSYTKYNKFLFLLLLLLLFSPPSTTATAAAARRISLRAKLSYATHSTMTLWLSQTKSRMATTARFTKIATKTTKMESMSFVFILLLFVQSSGLWHTSVTHWGTGVVTVLLGCALQFSKWEHNLLSCLHSYCESLLSRE